MLRAAALVHVGARGSILLTAALIGISGCGGGGDPASPRPPLSTVAGIDLSTPSLALVRGADSVVTGTVRMVEGSDAAAPTIVWSSADTVVARVVDGRVYAWGGGSTTVTASAGGKSARLPVTVTLPPRGEFQITWRFVGDVPASVRTAALGAADRLERVIVGDVPAVITALPDFCGGTGEETIDDVVIVVRMGDTPPGAMATGGPCKLVNGRVAPAGGQIVFAPSTASLPARIVENVVLHEVGHVLGVGTVPRWTELVLRSGTAPGFGGARAVAAYRALGFSGHSVPLDAGANHWAGGARLDLELMSPLGAHLSALSVAALGDLGYGVREDAAEPWWPSGTP